MDIIFPTKNVYSIVQNSVFSYKSSSMYIYNEEITSYLANVP